MTGVYLPSPLPLLQVKMYTFDPALQSITAKKERVVWLIFMGIVFFLLYGAANQLAGVTSPHPSFYMEWEKKIPFIEAFIIPYMSSDLMFVVAFLLPYTRLELRVLVARVLFIVFFSSLIFVLFPLQFAFEKPEIESFHLLFGLLEADLPFNQLPSLHISFAIVLWVSMKKYLHHTFLKALTLFWFFLIALSTLFVYQHHFIDIPTGLLMGIIAVNVIKVDEDHFFVSQFMTPRSLKMGLYFLLGAVVFMVLALKSSGFLAAFFLWIFLSLFSVSLVYAFGLNTLLAGKDVKASFWQWMLFSPYFLGSYLSWYYYKRKLSLMAHVKENIYLGRYPSQDEYEILKAEGIKRCINLATEQQCHTSKMVQTRFSFLDQTIQSPEALHCAVLQIEKDKEEGVYVHCALGLSRSVLLIWAWMLYKQYSLEEIEVCIEEVRPAYVKSPYMGITLDIYKEYLEELSE